MAVEVDVAGASDHLAELIDVTGGTNDVESRQRAQVSHHPVLPKETVRGRGERGERPYIIALQVRIADDLPSVVDDRGVIGVIAAKPSEVDRLAVLPEHRVRHFGEGKRRAALRPGHPDNLAAIVDG